MVLWVTPNGVGLRCPLKAVRGLCPVFFGVGIHLVNGDDLAVYRLGDHVLEIKSPPCKGVAAEGLAEVFWIGARARHHIDNAHLQHIAFRSAFNEGYVTFKYWSIITLVESTG